MAKKWKLYSVKMSNKVTKAFIYFLKEIDSEVQAALRNERNNLTQELARIQWSLWKQYKNFNGTSAGFYGISEYIVFSSVRLFIEQLNHPKIFARNKLSTDLFSFYIVNKNRSIEIFRSASTKYLMTNSSFNRVPDIMIAERKDGKYSLIAIIEIKNVLDKPSVIAGLKMITQIQNEFKYGDIKYALFSFLSLSLKEENTLKQLTNFSNRKNCFLITNTKGNKELNLTFLEPKEEVNEEIKNYDFRDFLKSIKSRVII